MSLFKGDATEVKMRAAGFPAFETIDIQKDAFYEEAFTCVPMAQLLYDTKRAPLTAAIPFINFKDAFNYLFENFPITGTFEVYLQVFRLIFGDDVEVEFTVPAPGKLEIDIVATGLEISNFVARRISGGVYVYDNVVTNPDGDQIVFQGVKGFQTQYELELMLFEMVVAGIYTVITLQIGEE